MTTQLWNQDFFNAKEQFFNFKKNGQPILLQLNYVAILMSSLKLFSVLIIGHINMTDWKALLIYTSPLLLCLVVHSFIISRKYNISFFLSFCCVPISVILLGRYEQMTFLIIYQIAYAVVAFFVLQKKSLIISSYIFSAVAIVCLGLNEIISTGKTNTYHIPFLIINYLIFFIPFYFIMCYLRRIIEQSQKSIKDKRNRLAIQNEILEKLNIELIEQEHLLAVKHQALTESAAFQNKILAILSHDIRTPLISIRNLFSAFSKNKTSQETIVEYLPEIKDNINYLYGLFEDMLSWSKEQRVHCNEEKTYINLKEISEEICQSYYGSANAKKITLFNNISNTKIIHANERYLKVIVRNFLSNAIKFTDCGGQITISAHQQGKFDIFSVKDTGRGISNDILHKIRNGIESSSKGTLNESGTGLGLYFCNEFANKSGGKLTVESEIGKGSVFSFLLPSIAS